jgi:hypothetical protein
MSIASMAASKLIHSKLDRNPTCILIVLNPEFC